MPAGRPTKYKKEYAKQAFNLCLLGARDSDIARFFEVEEKTINTWKKRHPEFLHSLRQGKDEADANVAKSLYQRALGVTVKETRVSGGGGDDEAPSATETTKELPPDTTAAIFWLKNRQRHLWRDKHDHEMTGQDGGPMQLEQTVTFVPAKLDDE